MKNKNNISITQDGGECLGAGTFGCVLKPYISCSGSKKSNVGSTSINSTNPNIISKMSTYNAYDSGELSDIYDEIQVGSKVYKLDKKCEYLCPIIKYCKINIEDVKFRDDIKFKNLRDMEDIDLEYETKEYEKKCLFNII